MNRESTVLSKTFMTSYSMWKWVAALMLITALLVVGALSAQAQTGVSVFTYYTGLAAEPGESLRYPISIENNSDQTKHVRVWMEDMPESWTYSLVVNNRTLRQMSIPAGALRSDTTLNVQVPLEVAQGEYTFHLVSEVDGVEERLPIMIEIVEEGVYATELTVQQSNMQGHADSSFIFRANLNNLTAEGQLYSLGANPPSGWQVRFQTGGQNITSVNVEPGEIEDMNIRVAPPPSVTEGKYVIPVFARSGNSEDELELEVIIEGSYGLTLTTSNELYSFEAKAGRSETVDLVLKNTGTADLSNIRLLSVEPTHWDVEFESSTIQQLPAGQSKTVRATVTPYESAIAGDYVFAISANADEATDTKQFRVEVTTPLLWGWIGFLIIAAVLLGILYLFRKYGRR